MSTAVPPFPDGIPPLAGRRAVALAIAFTGLAMLVSLTVWLVVMSGRDASSGSPAKNGAMTSMPGMTTTGSAAATVADPISLPANAAALAAAHHPFPAELASVPPGTLHHYTITLKDRVFPVAPGIRYTGWTFGSAPGPVIHVRQGDMVDVELVNGGAIPHSIDFHAADVAPNVDFATVAHGKSIHFRFRANTPGAFMYHCGTAPVLAHIANGMYGAIIVDPKGGMPKVDHSVVLVSSEWYLGGKAANGRTRSTSAKPSRSSLTS